MSIVDFLSEDQEMDVAETVEIMEVSEDIPNPETEETQSIVLVQSTERQKTDLTNGSDIGVQIVDLSEMENECHKYDYLHDSSNIIGKNLSAILTSDNITEKRLLEILNEGDSEVPEEVVMDSEEPTTTSEGVDNELYVDDKDKIFNNLDNANIIDNICNNGNKKHNIDDNSSTPPRNDNNIDNESNFDNDKKVKTETSDCNNNNDDNSNNKIITINANSINNNNKKENDIDIEINDNIKLMNNKNDKRYCEPINKNYAFDPDLAVNHLQEKCDLGDLLEIERRVLLQPVEVLCHSDDDGDTPLMIIVSKTLEESSKLYENVFAMQERLMNIRICCQKPIEDFLDSCQICGCSNEDKFLSPLSSKNNMGDTALTCAMKMEHSEMIINYLLSGISRNENDVRKVFDEESIEFLQEQVRYYPSLLRFIKPENETRIN